MDGLHRGLQRNKQIKDLFSALNAEPLPSSLSEMTHDSTKKWVSDRTTSAGASSGTKCPQGKAWP